MLRKFNIQFDFGLFCLYSLFYLLVTHHRFIQNGNNLGLKLTDTRDHLKRSRWQGHFKDFACDLVRAGGRPYYVQQYFLEVQGFSGAVETMWVGWPGFLGEVPELQYVWWGNSERLRDLGSSAVRFHSTHLRPGNLWIQQSLNPTSYTVLWGIC